MRYYSTTAGEMILQAGITAGNTSLVVDTTSGLPVTFPYTLIVDYGAAAEEIVEVTAVAGTTLTVTRGEDGTVAQSHDFGAVIRHGVTAQDFRESREHEAATAAHGATGAVVGTTNTQTLTNKTIDGGTVDADTLTKGGVNVPTISETATLTNKDLSSATNTFPTSLATNAEVTSEIATHAADTTSHGVTTGAIVGTTSTQTLTNKTMSGASNTFSSIPQSAVTSLTTDLAALDTRLDSIEGPQRVHAYQSTPPSVSDATTTAQALVGELYDTDTMHSNVTNNTRVVFKTAGLYDITAGLEWPNNATGNRRAQLRVNGTDIIAGDSKLACDGISTQHCISAPYQAAANDYVELLAYQSSGGALTPTGGDRFLYVTAVRRCA